ncbi:short-chain fatty acid transporter [Halocatena salina]|uniref:TIGR00366 family protein n=1 Tax=Halocatena salina TaxID=2934340 RepID=A0A8U0A5I6_9EURY|nr:TIGR00366 family protein [Halocatena salina]UPM43213.1 TIGR00366 family protein [Halocatena salina]
MSPEWTSAGSGNWFERAGHRLAGVVERWMPSPFLFAIILSYVVFVAGIVLEGVGPTAMVGHWFDGFWTFLSFGMQMVLILMTGFVIAYHPRVNGRLRQLAQLPSTGRQAVVMVGVFSMAMAWVHWGFSLILGAIFAREMGIAADENGVDVHYPLLCVAGYMGLGLTWHWGLSGSAPLLLATEGNEFIELGVLDGVISTTRTIFHPYALALTTLGIGYAAVALALLTPSPARSRSISTYLSAEELDRDRAGSDPPTDPQAPAQRIDNSRVLGGVIALTGLSYVAFLFVTQGLDALTLNVVNFGFLFLGVALYTRPAVYRERFEEAASAASGIILLFPFFAGIQGMMNASGLSERLAETLLSVSTAETFPVIAWLTGSVVNLFVPSGGGEWIVLGPSVVDAAQQLGVPVGQATIAYAVGDAHTNLLNPFWALPLLAITGLKARELFGYAVAMLLLLIPFLSVALLVLPY